VFILRWGFEFEVVYVLIRFSVLLFNFPRLIFQNSNRQLILYYPFTRCLSSVELWRNCGTTWGCTYIPCANPSHLPSIKDFLG